MKSLLIFLTSNPHVWPKWSEIGFVLLTAVSNMWTHIYICMYDSFNMYFKTSLILCLVHASVWYFVNFFAAVPRSLAEQGAGGPQPSCWCACPAQRAVWGQCPLFCCWGFSWEKPHIQSWLCLRVPCLAPNRGMLGGQHPSSHDSREHGSMAVPCELLCVSCKGPCSGGFAESFKLTSSRGSDIMVSKVRSSVLCSTKLFPCV